MTLGQYALQVRDIKNITHLRAFMQFLYTTTLKAEIIVQ